MIRYLPILFAVAGLTGCQSAGGDPVTAPTFDAIGASETVRLTGTEPFWGGSITGSKMTYATPENPDGETIAVERFSGNNGVSYSGVLGGQKLDAIVTLASCNDGMSDRTYPFSVTLQIGSDKRSGCAWTEARPFEGPQNP